jgi:hypothetical protein
MISQMPYASSTNRVIFWILVISSFFGFAGSNVLYKYKTPDENPALLYE